MKSLSKASLIVQTCQPYSGRMFQMCLEMQLQFNDLHIGRMQIYLFPVIDTKYNYLFRYSVNTHGSAGQQIPVMPSQSINANN